jgi:hypothetical protein
MVKELHRIAEQYARLPDPEEARPLPLVANVRLALDVAACEGRPLLVIRKSSPELERRLAKLAWSEPFIGRFIYGQASNAVELSAIEGVKADAAVLTVQPDRFGLKGTVLAQTGAEATAEDLVKCLEEAASRFRGEPVSPREHVRLGKQAGLIWETAIPVTDPMERNAREAVGLPPSP